MYRRVRHNLHFRLLAASLLAAGCDQPGQAPVATGSTPAIAASLQGETYRQRPGYVVDSVLPTAEALRRFRVGLPPAPTSLRNAARSRDALVQHFAAAITRGDTAELRAIALDRAEFAYLIYPESPYVRPPYAQAPGVVWMMLQQGSASGLRRLLRDRTERGGWRLLAHRCDAGATIEGANRLWRNCRVQLARASGDTAWARLFGVIVERDGRFKFASYANDF